MSSVSACPILVLQLHEPIEEHNNYSEISGVKDRIATINSSGIYLARKLLTAIKLSRAGEQTVTHRRLYLLQSNTWLIVPSG